MDVQDFRKDFLEEIRSTAATEGEGSSTAFVNIMSDYLVNADVIPDFNNSFYIGSGVRNRKLRIDGYALDEFDFTMNLIVVDYSANEDNSTLTKKEAEQIFDWPMRFIEEIFTNNLSTKVEVSTSASDLIDLVTRNKDKICKYRLLLYTDRLMSGRIDNFEITYFNGVPIERQIWDVERLFKIVQAESGRESIEINFKKYTENGIPCLEANNQSLTDYRCFLGVIPGDVLANIYDHYGAQLLEGNVRSFLSTKVAVNKKIRQTILTEPKMFFAFNNGVSATATAVIVENNSKGKFITEVKDFQIINGGQTTASLSNARFKDRAELKNISLQIKLTEINEDINETQDLLQKISRSSNSQNKVSDADFFSTHPFHIRMEQISRRIFAPAVGGAQHDTHWFYERARGQHLQSQMRMKKSEKDKFLLQNPKNQLISKTDFAKAFNLWRCLPHVVSKGSQRNFKEFAEWIDKQWSSSPENFNEKFFQESVALYILFKNVETLIPHQSWYEKGYRANIVYYSISLFSNLVKKQFSNYTLDLQYIWNKQSVSKTITDQMVVITKAVYESITDPSRGNANVTQWCKQEECWNRIKAINIQLEPQIKEVLISKTELTTDARQAVKDQKLISGIEAQSEVVNRGTLYWKSLSEFVVKNVNVATLEERKSLKIACKLPSKLPNSVQSQQLLTLVEKAILEGWNKA